MAKLAKIGGNCLRASERGSLLSGQFACAHPQTKGPFDGSRSIEAAQFLPLSSCSPTLASPRPAARLSALNSPTEPPNQTRAPACQARRWWRPLRSPARQAAHTSASHFPYKFGRLDAAGRGWGMEDGAAAVGWKPLLPCKRH